MTLQLLNVPSQIGVIPAGALYHLDQVALDQVSVNPKFRPGALPAVFSQVTTGAPYTLAALSTAGVVTSPSGLVYQAQGPFLITPREAIWLEPSRIYTVRALFSQALDPTATIGNPVTVGIQWLDDQYNGISTTVVSSNNIKVASGLQTTSFRIPSQAGDPVTITPPAGAVYARPYIQAMATDGIIFFEAIFWADVTDVNAFSPDLNSTNSRVTALESINAGSRLGTLESEYTSLAAQVGFSPVTRKSLGDVVATIQSGGAVTITCYGDSLTYGQDTISGTTQAPINGATQTRSVHPYPETLAAAVQLALDGGTITVRNCGFPGDNSAQGVTRWSADTPGDVAIIMYGHNDTTTGITVAQYRANMRTMVNRAITAGAVVIIMTPPHLQNADYDKVIEPYRSAAKELAIAYGCVYVEAAEQIKSVPLDSTWIDGTHLTPWAYSEMGHHLSAFFLSRGAYVRKVAPGMTFYNADGLHYGGAQAPLADAKYGYVTQVDPGKTASYSFFVEEPCYAVLTTVNESPGTDRPLVSYYAQGLYFPIVNASNLGATTNRSIRRSYTLQKLDRGYRVLNVANQGTQSAFIESLKIVPLEYGQTTDGLGRVVNLAGWTPPRSTMATTDWLINADYGTFINPSVTTGTIRIAAYLTLDGTEPCGLTLLKDTQQAYDFLSGNQFMILRLGTSLIVRNIVNGAVTDTTVASVFAAGRWTGFLEFTINPLTGASAVYVDGVSVSSGVVSDVVSGYPGVALGGKGDFACHAITASEF